MRKAERGGLGEGVSTEAVALEAIARRDRDGALEALMKGYGAMLYGYCVRLLQDPALAEDVLQQTFEQAWVALPRYAHQSTLRTWLVGIAVHRCQDAMRRRGRSPKPADSPSPSALGVGEEPADEAPDAGERLHQERRRRVIEECLSQLETTTRMLVLLRYYEGLTFERIGELCQMKAGSVEARVRRAMPTLRECCKGKGFDDE